MAIDLFVISITAAIASLAVYVVIRPTMKAKAGDLDDDKQTSKKTKTFGFPWGRKSEKKPMAPFGTVLGITDGDVEVYSCNYKTVDPRKWLDRAWFEHYVDNQYCGFKWQCVELARRYLLLNRGITFDSIPMAYDIFRLKTVTRVSDGQKFPMIAHTNGDSIPPQNGSLLIWEPVGEFKRTGHVAVIVAVASQYVDIVEQNVEDAVWPDGIKYSRRLSVARDTDGNFTIHCTYPDSVILGWTNILNEPYSYDAHPNTRSTDITKRSISISKNIASRTWLDESVDYLKVFAESYGKPCGSPETPSPYYTIKESGEHALTHATNELHQMFLDATDYVLHHEKELGKYFRIPDKLWAKLRKSWYGRHDDMVSGRFDFTVTPNGLKVYEYNADSASCLLECGYIQDRWSDFVGLGDVGRGASSNLFNQLISTWREKKVDGPLHLLCDNDKEELYHSMYMRAAAEAAGIECFLLVGLSELTWTPNGNLQDNNGTVIRNVWKTWSWRTALNQLTDEEIIHFIEKEEEFERTNKVTYRVTPPRLVDVLLHLNIRIFEPLWTLIPSSKAILPVLWKLHPGHPYLLNSSFELTPEFEQKGYVAKPVTGRAGGNVALYREGGKLIERTEGKWQMDDMIYQELALLPKLEEDHVQFCTWAINGRYSGTVLRVDKSGIIGLQSAVAPLRVVPDNE
ncbi:bifunctional glutathionylspermidine amidase/glutathionylspermidine synthetase [Cladochytrium replicatum]|nr:bifunctional glutathionylspermidine amidase/glutathionylspermidine synthetase [Cladochytrium replicatum]